MRLYKFIKLPSGGLKAKHRLIMEQYLGRKLQTYEIVHHIDGNKLNNHINNLKLTTREEHGSTHGGNKKKGNYNPYNKIKEEKVKQIIEYYSHGMNYSKISKIVDVSDMVVRKYCINYKNQKSKEKSNGN